MTLPIQPSPRVAALLEKTRLHRGRMIFALDATASRQRAWDLACQLQSEMFAEVAKIGGLAVQLTWYRGYDECRSSAWTLDADELARAMRRITCEAGHTQIGKVLAHVRAEHAREKVAAAVFIGDAVEEPADRLYNAAAGLGVPVFCFQEGEDEGPQAYFTPRTAYTPHTVQMQSVAQVFGEIARLSGGASARFDAGAAAKLGELLRAVASFATGGVAALANLNTESARKLLSQMK